MALCQCLKCGCYLATSRNPLDMIPENHWCTECGGSCRIAVIRGTLVDPLQVELLALLDEEGHEVGQRIGKILRWGFDADFEGTTQRWKLENELGDLLAAMIIAEHNGLISIDEVMKHRNVKLAKFREDAAGPRQRLLHAKVPDDARKARLPEAKIVVTKDS